MSCYNKSDNNVVYINYDEQWEVVKNIIRAKDSTKINTIIDATTQNQNLIEQILLSNKSIHKITSTKYNDLLEIDFFGKKVKVFEFEDNYKKHQFYISETPQGLKVIGYINNN